VYASNQTQPMLWEVCGEEESDGEEFVCSTGEANVEVSVGCAWLGLEEGHGVWTGVVTVVVFSFHMAVHC